MPVKEVTHITIHIITAEQKRVMQMSNEERAKHMDEEAARQNAPQAWNSSEQNLNPFPKWVRDFFTKMSSQKPRFDPLNRLYYIAVDGDMAEAYDWMETFDEALKKECESDPEKAAWSADNCLKASITDADEAASMSDLEGFLRGSAPDYADKAKNEKEDQDEGPDEDDPDTEQE